MKQIDSGALTLLNRALGLSGSGAQTASIDDGMVNSVLDVARIARRSRTFGREGGLYLFGLQNAHAAANNQTSTVTPYAPGTALIWNGYPATVPDGFDVYILGAGLMYMAGTAGNFGAGLLFLSNDHNVLGAGVDQAGGALSGTITIRIPLAHWDDLADLGGGIVVGNTEHGDPWVPMNLRVPRGPDGSLTTLNFSTTSTGAVTARAHVLMGIFPSALGQDATT